MRFRLSLIRYAQNMVLQRLPSNTKPIANMFTDGRIAMMVHGHPFATVPEDLTAILTGILMIKLPS